MPSLVLGIHGHSGGGGGSHTASGGAYKHLHHRGLPPQARVSTASVAVQGSFLDFS